MILGGQVGEGDTIVLDVKDGHLDGSIRGGIAAV